MTETTSTDTGALYQRTADIPLDELTPFSGNANPEGRIVGHAALAQRMKWSSAAVARTMSSRATRRRQEGTSRPGDLPPPDGHLNVGKPRRKTPYWLEATIAAWEVSRPNAEQESRNLPDGLKVCSKCKETKPISEYGTYRNKRRPDNESLLMAKCKTCQARVAQAWQKQNPERRDAANRKWRQRTRRRYKARLYGLTEIELAALEASQQGHCLICKEFAEGGLVVDHDHSTGHVRGLLCSPCNLGLGAFRDNPQRLLAAILYLKAGNRGVFD